MRNLTRWDPFREMTAWRSLMDRMFDSDLDSPAVFQQNNWGLALDVSEDENEFVVKASLPGLNPEDLDITYSNNVLTIQGEVEEEKETEQHRYHLRERRWGTFTRSIQLPAGVKSDQIDAQYEAGVLTLRLPKVEEVKPKRIAIKSAGGPQMIEGRAKEIASKN